MNRWLERLTDRHRPCRQATNELATLITAERDRARWARSELGNILAIATITPNSERRRISDLRATLEGPAPNPLTGLDLSNPHAPRNPSAGHHG